MHVRGSSPWCLLGALSLGASACSAQPLQAEGNASAENGDAEADATEASSEETDSSSSGGDGDGDGDGDGEALADCSEPIALQWAGSVTQTDCHYGDLPAQYNEPCDDPASQCFEESCRRSPPIPDCAGSLSLEFQSWPIPGASAFTTVEVDGAPGYEVVARSNAELVLVDAMGSSTLAPWPNPGASRVISGDIDADGDEDLLIFDNQAPDPDPLEVGIWALHQTAPGSFGPLPSPISELDVATLEVLPASTGPGAELLLGVAGDCYVECGPDDHWMAAYHFDGTALVDEHDRRFTHQGRFRSLELEAGERPALVTTSPCSFECEPVEDTLHSSIATDAVATALAASARPRQWTRALDACGGHFALSASLSLDGEQWRFVSFALDEDGQARPRAYWSVPRSGDGPWLTGATTSTDGAWDHVQLSEQSITLLHAVGQRDHEVCSATAAVPPAMRAADPFAAQPQLADLDGDGRVELLWLGDTGLVVASLSLQP